jgi:hypothetical protein
MKEGPVEKELKALGASAAGCSCPVGGQLGRARHSGNG